MSIMTNSCNKNKTLIIACGALANEILAIKKLNTLDHIDLQCLPAILHNTPKDIPDAVAKKIDEFENVYDTIYVAYGDCGTGGLLDNVLSKKNIQRIEGAHCYAFFSGNEYFLKASEEEITAFYLTDFLVRFFDSFFWKSMGLDKHPQLRDMYFAHYEKVVYLAQTDDTELQRLAQEAAAKIGLEYEYRYTGYGDLETFVKKTI